MTVAHVLIACLNIEISVRIAILDYNPNYLESIGDFDCMPACKELVRYVFPDLRGLFSP